MPLIKEYLEIGVKNDEQLIKMATIVQRVINNSSGESSLGITDSEKEELMEELALIDHLHMFCICPTYLTAIGGNLDSQVILPNTT